MMCLRSPEDSWFLLMLRRGFLHQGMDSAIIHFSGLPWSSRPFDVVELTSAFFLLKNVANQGFCYLSYRCFFVFFNDGLLHFHQYLLGLHIGSNSQTASKCQFDMSNQPQIFYLLNLSRSNEGMESTWSINLFLVNCTNIIEPLKMEVLCLK